MEASRVACFLASRRALPTASKRLAYQIRLFVVDFWNLLVDVFASASTPEHVGTVPSLQKAEQLSSISCSWSAALRVCLNTLAMQPARSGFAVVGSAAYDAFLN